MWPGQVAGVGGGWVGLCPREGTGVWGQSQGCEEGENSSFALDEPLGHSEQRRGCVLRS